MLQTNPSVNGAQPSPVTTPPTLRKHTVPRPHQHPHHWALPHLLPGKEAWSLTDLCPRGLGLYKSWSPGHEGPVLLPASYQGWQSS